MWYTILQHETTLCVTEIGDVMIRCNLDVDWRFFARPALPHLTAEPNRWTAKYLLYSTSDFMIALWTFFPRLSYGDHTALFWAWLYPLQTIDNLLLLQVFFFCLQHLSLNHVSLHSATIVIWQTILFHLLSIFRNFPNLYTVTVIIFFLYN